MAKKKVTRKQQTPKKTGSRPPVKAHRTKKKAATKKAIRKKTGPKPKDETLRQSKKRKLDKVAPIPEDIQKEIKRNSKKGQPGDTKKTGGFAKGNTCGHRFTSETARAAQKRAMVAKKPITAAMKFWGAYPAYKIKFARELAESHDLHKTLPKGDYQNLTVDDVIAISNIGHVADGDSSFFKEVMNRTEGKQVDRLEALINKDKMSTTEMMALVEQRKKAEKRKGKA